MTGSGELECRMDLEKINGEMVLSIKDTTKMSKRTELANTHGLMAAPTVANGRIIRCKVTAAIDGPMEGSISVSGKRATCMVLASLNGPVVKDMKADGSRGRSMAKDIHIIQNEPQRGTYGSKESQQQL